jgi:hypothetical protein
VGESSTLNAVMNSQYTSPDVSFAHNRSLDLTEAFPEKGPGGLKALSKTRHPLTVPTNARVSASQAYQTLKPTRQAQQTYLAWRWCRAPLAGRTLPFATRQSRGFVFPKSSGSMVLLKSMVNMRSLAVRPCESALSSILIEGMEPPLKVNLNSYLKKRLLYRTYGWSRRLSRFSGVDTS